MKFLRRRVKILELYKFEEFLIKVFSILMFLTLFLNLVIFVLSFYSFEGKRRIKFALYNLSNLVAAFTFLLILIDISYNFNYGVRVREFSDIRYLLLYSAGARIMFIDQLRKNNFSEKVRTVFAVLKLLVIISLLPFTDSFISYTAHKVIFYIACILLIDENTAIGIRTFLYLKRNVTLISIVEAFAKLESGVIFADKKGRVRLINPYMSELMKEAGIYRIENLSEISRLFEKLDVRSFGKDRIVTFKNGKTYQIIKDEVKIKNKKYIQAVFNDITKLYNLNKKLEMKNEQLEYYNEEISEILKNIDDIILEKESIKIRQQVHDIIGQRLSIVNAATGEIEMTGHSNAKLEDLNELIDTLIEDMKRERLGTYDDIFEYLKESFSIVGVNIDIEGKIPKNPKIRNSIALILREAITNAICHANANEINMKIEEDIDSIVIEIWDNGEIKETKISEGTGMRGIRRRVEEDLGGKLEIILTDGFKMKITVPA